MTTIRKTEYPEIGELLYSAELENGLRVMLIPKKDFSLRYAVIGTSYGGIHRRFRSGGELIETPAGVAHFLEHKMFEMPSGEDAMTLFASTGASPNAFTSPTLTCYHFDCTEDFEENLRILLRMVSTPYFTEENVAKEQGIIGQEIKMYEDDPGSALYYDMLGALFRSHPFKDKMAGSLESIAQISPKLLKACHSAFYASSNMILCVEGDVDIEQVLSIAQEELGKERADRPVPEEGEAESLLPEKKESCRIMPVSTPQFLLGAKLPPNQGETLRNRLSASVALNVMLGRSSRFYTELYAEKLINRDFGYSIDYVPGANTFILGGESRDCRRVCEEFFTAVDKVCLDGLDEADFRRSKRSAIGGVLRSSEDFGSLCDSILSYAFEGIDYLSTMRVLESVEKSDCEAFITENLIRERFALAMLLPEKEEEDRYD